MSEDQRPPFLVIGIAWLMAFGLWMPLFVIPPIEDVISQQLSISHTQASLLYSLPVAMLALVAIPAGFLADRIGIKKAIGLGAAIITAGSVLRGITDSYPVIVVFSIVYGIGLGMCFPNIPKLARHCSTRERSHFVVSIFTVGIISSGALSLAITTPLYLPITGDIRGVFFISTAPIFLALILWWMMINDPPCQTAGTEPVKMDIRLLRQVVTRGDLWIVSGLFLLHNFVLYSWAGWLPQFLTTIGASADQAGVITSVTLWVGLPSVIIVGQLSARMQRRKPFLWGPTILLAITTFAIFYVDISWSWLIVALTGIATSVRFSTVLALPVEMVEPHQSGSASGMTMSVGYLGALAGPLIGGIILDATSSYYGIFLTMAVVSVLTIILTLIIPETGRHAA